MHSFRETIIDELRSCVRRGLPLPSRPEPADLWNATGGDGPIALLVMLEFVSAERAVRDERLESEARERQERRELADILAA